MFRRTKHLPDNTVYMYIIQSLLLGRAGGGGEGGGSMSVPVCRINVLKRGPDQLW